MISITERDDESCGPPLRWPQVARPLSDDELCDLMRRDAAGETAAGRPPRLLRYLRAVPDLASNPAALDTAIQIAIDATVKLGMTRPEAISRLAIEHPELREAIEISTILDAMLESSSVWKELAVAAAPIELPAEFGPEWRDGQARYLLVECVAMGAHGTVYRAQDRALSAPDRTSWAAIKLIHDAPALGFDAARREAVRARRIDHPNVARVLEAGQTTLGACFLAFEFVEGRSLNVWRRAQSGRASEHDAVKMALQIAEGLAASHAAGVTHGDLHPGNVMVGNDGEIKVIDFGLGRLPFERNDPAPGAAMGFVAPEVYRRQPNARMDLADIYSVGALLYWLLTDRHANGDSVPEAEERLVAQSGGPSDPREHRPQLDPDLAWIVRRALANSTEDRYPSMAALAADLHRRLANEPLSWRPTSLARTLRLTYRRSPLSVALVAGGAVLALSLAAMTATLVSTHFWRQMTVNLMQQREAAMARAEAERARAQAGDALNRELNEKIGRSEDVRLMMNMLKSFISTAPNGKLPDRLVSLTLLMDQFSEKSEAALLTAADPTLAKRVEAARAVIQDLEADPVRNAVKLLAWRSALAAWLVESQEYGEARLHLASVRSLCARLPGGGGEIAEDLATLDEIAELLMIPARGLSEAQWSRCKALSKEPISSRLKALLGARLQSHEEGLAESR